MLTCMHLSGVGAYARVCPFVLVQFLIYTKGLQLLMATLTASGVYMAAAYASHMQPERKLVASTMYVLQHALGTEA